MKIINRAINGIKSINRSTALIIFVAKPKVGHLPPPTRRRKITLADLQKIEKQRVQRR